MDNIFYLNYHIYLGAEWLLIKFLGLESQAANIQGVHLFKAVR